MDDQIRISNIAAKLMSKPDEDGNVTFAVKATVTNTSDEPISFAFDLQGIDGDDFEVTDVFLGGELGPKESRTVTDRAFISMDDWGRIVRWQAQ